MDSLFDILLGKSLSGGGGGGGGTSNYNALENKPSINSVTLTGNKSLSDLGIAAASDIPTVNNGTLTIQKNGTKIDEFKANQSANTTINITVPTTASDVSALPSSTKYAAALSLTINSSTYVVTGQLKDQNGDNLGSAQTIDLPLETMVVGGSYDDEHKKIVLTLKNGNTVDIPVADLVSGLQTELSATNKLDPAFINYDSTHAVVTEADKTAWSSKQDALTFDGTYSASTNKAATVSTVTNAINALDVTGASGISAAKTISAWSETDGKVSVSTQDIAITGTQAVLTGYQKSTTAGQAVAATDNVNQAIGKVEKRVSDNENNILWNAYKGVKNVLDFQTWVVNCSVVNATKTVSANTINIAAGSSNSYTEYLSNYPTNTDINVNEGDVYQLSWTYSRTGGSGRGSIYAYAMDNSNTVITSANAQGTTGKLSIIIPTGATKLRISIAVPANTSESYGYMMICLKSLYDADSAYQPYALSNSDLTAKNAVNENNISSLNQYAGGKNKFNIDSATINASDASYTKNSDGTINVTKSTNTIGQVNMQQAFLGETGTYIISGCPSGGSSTTYEMLIQSGNTVLARDYGEGASVSLTKGTEYQFKVVVRESQTLSNKLFKPMISTEGGDYQPYAMSNAELTEITNNFNNVKSVITNTNTTFTPDTNCHYLVLIQASTSSALYAVYKTSAINIAKITGTMTSDSVTESGGVVTIATTAWSMISIIKIGKSSN